MSGAPRFLTKAEVLAIHQKQIAAFGGALGLRDEGMLESALGRPLNRWHYENANLARLAADHAYGIALNHPFADGNKRAAFMAAYVFLGLNGLKFNAPEADVVVVILALAAGEIGEDALTAWFTDHVSTGL